MRSLTECMLGKVTMTELKIKYPACTFSRLQICKIFLHGLKPPMRNANARNGRYSRPDAQHSVFISNPIPSLTRSLVAAQWQRCVNFEIC